MMKLITRDWKVSRFIFQDMSEFPLKVYLLNRVADFPKEKIMNLPENDYQILGWRMLFICIPYRTEINHEYAFHFVNTARAKVHKSGLDYSKIVIIEKTNYIDTAGAVIDKDEFNETMVNLERIKKEALAFVEDYVELVKGTRVLHTKQFYRRYVFSPLKYFHKELGI